MILFFLLGTIHNRTQLKEQSIETGEYDESFNDLESGEPPPDETNRYDKHKRIVCHACEDPHCLNLTRCTNAVSCFKSRVRDSTGKHCIRFLMIRNSM